MSLPKQPLEAKFPVHTTFWKSVRLLALTTTSNTPTRTFLEFDRISR